MNTAQRRLYFAEFRRAAEVLQRRGFSDADCEEWRRGVNLDVSGQDSSAGLRGASLSAALAAFRAVWSGALPDITATVPGVRRRIDAALATLAPTAPQRYLEAVADRLGLPPAQSRWSVQDWVSLIGALEGSVRRRRK